QVHCVDRPAENALQTAAIHFRGGLALAGTVAVFCLLLGTTCSTWGWAAVMRKILIVLGLFGLSGAISWVYTSARYVIWDGGFDLTVNVSSTAGLPRSVSCQAFGHKEEAEQALDYLLSPETRLWSVVVDPFEGKPITLFVPTSGTASMSGRELSRVQFRYLVVIATLPDGRRVGKLAEIPDSRQSREVSVALP